MNANVPFVSAVRVGGQARRAEAAPVIGTTHQLVAAKVEVGIYVGELEAVVTAAAGGGRWLWFLADDDGRGSSQEDCCA